MRAIIGTWKMSFAGVNEALNMLKQGASAGEAVVHAVKTVEDNPAFHSVGYGGLPGRDGHVTLDAAFMDGRSLRMGGVMSVENIKNPILAAYRLCGKPTNCLLAGRGAEEFAVREGLPLRDMRTPDSMKQWAETLSKQADKPLDAYRGHDTVCVLALDESGNMAAGTSTSGLFMKEPGRVGDTPLIGSGFYCDARFGAAAATGVGEDIMRGCLSYEIVTRMRRGELPREACQNALDELVRRKLELGEDAGNISLIALAPDGAFGAATTLPVFPFAAGGSESAVIYMVENKADSMIRPADAEKLAILD